MVKLNPQRRRAATNAGGAAAALLMVDSQSVPLHFFCGILIGVSLAVNLGPLIRSRLS